MKKQLKGKQSFYDDKQRENVVSYYLMEDQEHTMYGVELEKYQEETNVIEWDAVPSISESMELVDRVIHNLIKYKVTPISLAESLDEIMRDFRKEIKIYCAYCSSADRRRSTGIHREDKKTILGCKA